jgi:hypothetical protein
MTTMNINKVVPKPVTLADLPARHLRVICETRGVTEIEIERESISDSKGNEVETVRTFRIRK